MSTNETNFQAENNNNIDFKFESTKINLDLNSLSKEDIYNKLFEIIKAREKQIRDLSVNLGSLNVKYHSVINSLNQILERNQKLEAENISINEKLLKKEAILKQELNSKEIMFIKLE